MAQDVCHVVRSQLPHYSPTRMSGTFNHLVQSLTDKNLSAEQFSKRLELVPYAYCSKNNCIDKIKKIRKKYNRIAFNDLHRANNVIDQLTETKMGNCGENASVSAIVLKMNGINAVQAKLLLNNSSIDHEVCVFNRDNSKFNGRVNKNTIVVDSWLGIADFANNMFLKYKNLFYNFLNIGMPEKISKFSFGKIKQFNLSSKSIKLLKEDHPEFILKGNYSSKK
jgi:hypothetical protein